MPLVEAELMDHLFDGEFVGEPAAKRAESDTD